MIRKPLFGLFRLCSLLLVSLCWVSIRAEEAGVQVVLQGGPGSESGVMEPFSVEFDSAGAMYGVEFTQGNRVFKQTPDGHVSFIAGKAAVTDPSKPLEDTGDGGPATDGRFNGLHDLCLVYSSTERLLRGEVEDVLLLADTFNHRIRRIDLTTGILSTIAGSGYPGYADGSKVAGKAQFNQPISLSPTNHQGEVWVADIGNNRVRILDYHTGKVRDIIGNGEKGSLIERAEAGETPLNGPRAVVAQVGTVWIALRQGNALVQDLKGEMRTVVNLPGKAGYAGDGTADLAQARLNGPKYLCQDDDLNIIICDTENHVIRRLVPGADRGEGRLELLAGIPAKPGATIGSTALQTQLNRPHGARVHKGWLYIADSNNHRVLRTPYVRAVSP